MLHPKSGKSKRGKYEYTHKVCICFPIIQCDEVVETRKLNVFDLEFEDMKINI